MNLKEDDYVVNGLLVHSEGDTPIVIVTQRGGVKRMLAQELTQLGTSKTWTNGLAGIEEKNPHRVVFMSESTDLDLLVTTQKKAHKKLFSRKKLSNQ